MKKTLTREIVKMYSVLFENDGARELMSWYVKVLQRAVDIIWSNIAWRCNFRNCRNGRYAHAQFFTGSWRIR